MPNPKWPLPLGLRQGHGMVAEPLEINAGVTVSHLRHALSGIDPKASRKLPSPPQEPKNENAPPAVGAKPTSNDKT